MAADKILDAPHKSDADKRKAAAAAVTEIAFLLNAYTLREKVAKYVNE